MRSLSARRRRDERGGGSGGASTHAGADTQDDAGGCVSREGNCAGGGSAGAGGGRRRSVDQSGGLRRLRDGYQKDLLSVCGAAANFGTRIGGDGCGGWTRRHEMETGRPGDEFSSHSVRGVFLLRATDVFTMQVVQEHGINSGIYAEWRRIWRIREGNAVGGGTGNCG